MEIVSWMPLVFNKNNSFVSRYPDIERVWKIVNVKEFITNRDDLINNGFDYRSWEKFFEQFQKLFKSVSLSPMITQMKNENSDFADTVVWAKDCYLSTIIVEACENVVYSFLTVNNSRNVFNSVMTRDFSENIYFSVMIGKSFNIFYSKFIESSNNIWFSTNLIWCSECIKCDSLENKKYCIENKEYSSEEYKIKKAKILFNKLDFLNFYKSLTTKSNNNWSKNYTWNVIEFSENVENGYFSYRAQDSKNIMFTWSMNWIKNMYDCFDTWLESNDFYWAEGCWTYSNHIYCSSQIEKCNNIFYSYYLNTCSYCIWCVWLTWKSYCILNKQYEKREWEELADKIFAQMDTEWILWEFFPWEINPFYFNDTMAWIIWGFTKQQVEKKWYMWRDKEIKVDIPVWAEVIETKDLNKFEWFDKNWKWQINKEILKKVIVDDKWNYYRIIEMEYEFLLKYSLPLPEIHWMDRIKLNLWV
jgi:hypothetical protein